MKYMISSAVALLVAPVAVAQTATPAQTTAPAPTDPSTQAAQTTGDPTTPPAQTPPPTAKPTVGATVYGSAGTPVGTIKAMDATLVTLTTDKGEVRLPVAGIGTGPNGPTIGMTAEQLDAAIDQAKAAQPAATTSTTTKTSTTTRKRAAK